MRFLVKVSMGIEEGNKAQRDGTMMEKMGRILNDLKPEAVYFTGVDGQRTVFIVVNIQDASQMPSIAEPLWLMFGGSVEMHPVMTLEDLQKAGPDLERVAKTYG